MPRLIAIDDPADARIAPYRDVRERDLVGRDGLFVAEGKVVLEKLVDSTQARPQSLLIADKRVAALATLMERLPDDLPVYTADQPVLDAVAGFPLHRGILAIGRRVDPPTPDQALAAAAAAGRDVLLLSAIANHDNMGGIFRNAAGFGAGAVLLDRDCCDPLYRKAIRVSVGATLLVPFARLAAGADALALLDAYGFSPLALSPNGAERLADLRPQGRQAVLLGAEGPGLSPALLARTRSVRIDMADGFDSLNVATTSGIVLHHLATRDSAVAAGNQPR
ncbi:TrmH family RNA methyltransferase [Sphingomonas abaci]|uniref:tRNA G18 (Ribose-2'-O)-methylase SpoU n=1 Tax=Sphingomonas abaci TaxID=237611 RepID=A0A7W7AH69_9SPHN|nr:RNA methyltransferase [Sphingomonas abaci]MBB4616959.1 tRNA G18 (ribose-2'-O)-methylase SpoU [Sphingomonas abaci]